MTKSYQAFATGGFKATAESPKKAAETFFEKFPNKRKCDILEGVVDGMFFTVSFGRSSTGDWPYSVKDITRKTLGSLPA